MIGLLLLKSHSWVITQESLLSNNWRVKADANFTVPQKAEGWVDVAGYRPRWSTRASIDGHPSKY